MRTIDSMHALVVDREALAPQHQRQPPVPESTPLVRERLQPLEQMRILDSAHAILHD